MNGGFLARVRTRGTLAAKMILAHPEKCLVQAMIRRRTDVSRWRHMLHGERINYGMLAYESAKR